MTIPTSPAENIADPTPDMTTAVEPEEEEYADTSMLPGEQNRAAMGGMTQSQVALSRRIRSEDLMEGASGYGHLINEAREELGGFGRGASRRYDWRESSHPLSESARYQAETGLTGGSNFWSDYADTVSTGGQDDAGGNTPTGTQTSGGGSMRDENEVGAGDGGADSPEGNAALASLGINVANPTDVAKMGFMSFLGAPAPVTLAKAFQTELSTDANMAADVSELSELSGLTEAEVAMAIVNQENIFDEDSVLVDYGGLSTSTTSTSATGGASGGSGGGAGSAGSGTGEGASASGAGAGPHGGDSRGDGGGGGGGKIICTALNDMYGFGSYRNRIWLEYDKKIGSKLPGADLLEMGYHKLFMPLAKAMPNHPLMAKILRRIVTVRSARCRNELRGQPITLEQKFYKVLFEAPCKVAGWLVKKGFLTKVNV